MHSTIVLPGLLSNIAGCLRLNEGFLFGRATCSTWALDTITRPLEGLPVPLITSRHFRLWLQPYRLPGSSPQLSLNHLALRRSPLTALQNQTDDARDRA